jgi:ABC-type transport system involved in multi-copper enzyme maturation permease subunit
MRLEFGAGLWPVVQRELRESARRPLNHWMRSAAAAGGIATLFSAFGNSQISRIGMHLFENINEVMFFLICGLVPALTADCISGERREGTLGLLFMTPLSASGIVLGKVAARVLRIVTVWLAITPLLTIPFLYGGLSWVNVGAWLAVQSGVGMLCLAAGILASSLTEKRAIAFILAFLFTALFIGEAMAYLRKWNLFSNTPSLATILAQEYLASFLLFVVSIRFAGWRVERSWQDKIPSSKQENLVKRYCSPLFGRRFSRNMRRTLERNPVAWLQQYSWKARASKWGLCLLFVVLECGTVNGNDLEGFSQTLAYLLLVLVAAYTFAGANGFIQEKKNGALELLLVTPLSVEQIIFGRVWGLWKQFFPSMLVLVGSDIAFHLMTYGNSFYYGSGPASGLAGWRWSKDIEIVAVFLVLPVVATCFALTSKNLMIASALTTAMVCLPAALVLFPDMIISVNVPAGFSYWLLLEMPLMMLAAFPIPVFLFHAWSATWTYRRLKQTLRRRAYAF